MYGVDEQNFLALLNVSFAGIGRRCHTSGCTRLLAHPATKIKNAFDELNASRYGRSGLEIGSVRYTRNPPLPSESSGTQGTHKLLFPPPPQSNVPTREIHDSYIDLPGKTG